MTTWRYRLGHQKLLELGVALGLGDDRVPGLRAAFFLYASVPALRAILVDPGVAERRSDLALTRLVVRWTELPKDHDFEGRLIAVRPEEERVQAAGVCLSAGAVFCEFLIELAPGGEPSHPPPLRTVRSPHASLEVDAARVVAFSASTWDLNPAYWDREFAASVGLPTTVASPWLAAAWLVELGESEMGRSFERWDVTFQRVPHVGERLAAELLADGDGLVAVASTDAGPAVTARFEPAPPG